MNITDIKVSFTILVHNETSELKRLLEQIKSFKTLWDEVIIVDDFSDNPETLQLLEWAKADDSLHANVQQHKLNGDFSQQKNFANSLCKNDYIFNIDADEYLDDNLVKTFREILFINPEVEYFRLPRVNKVDGITINDIGQWGWNISSLRTEIEDAALSPDSELLKLLKLNKLVITENNGMYKFYTPIINWPDAQGRIYKNKKEIVWINKVHELVIGFRKYANFPMDKKFAILHYKSIQKQQLQNNFYSNM